MSDCQDKNCPNHLHSKVWTSPSFPPRYLPAFLAVLTGLPSLLVGSSSWTRAGLTTWASMTPTWTSGEARILVRLNHFSLETTANQITTNGEQYQLVFPKNPTRKQNCNVRRREPAAILSLESKIVWGKKEESPTWSIAMERSWSTFGSVRSPSLNVLVKKNNRMLIPL